MWSHDTHVHKMCNSAKTCLMTWQKFHPGLLLSQCSGSYYKKDYVFFSSLIIYLPPWTNSGRDLLLVIRKPTLKLGCIISIFNYTPGGTDFLFILSLLGLNRTLESEVDTGSTCHSSCPAVAASHASQRSCVNHTRSHRGTCECVLRTPVTQWYILYS